MSDGRPVPSVAPAGGGNKPQRAIYRTVCEKHNLEYGRELVASTPEHESYLLGNCPRCLEDARIFAEWEEKLTALGAEIKAETDAQCEAESGRPGRITEMGFALMDEDRAKRFAEWKQNEDEHFAALVADYLAYADNQDRARIDGENIEKRRIAYFEQQRSIKAQADAELQAKLDADREQKAKEALASWVTF